MFKTVLLALSLATSQAYACLAGGNYFPQTTTNFASRPGPLKEGMTEALFGRIIDQVVELYRDEIEARGKELVINKIWKSGVINASAGQSRDRWILNLSGGMARHPLMTSESFAMVVCHELGHHLGGAPKVTYNPALHWASTEGQSDYFASSKCMKSFFQEYYTVENEKGEKRKLTAKEIRHNIKSAGLRLGHLLASLSNFPNKLSYERKDLRVAEQSIEGHPNAQCRLDTYKAGALCPLSHEELGDDTNPRMGACHRGDSISMDLNNLYAKGVRPLCWYNPQEF